MKFLANIADLSSTTEWIHLCIGEAGMVYGMCRAHAISHPDERCFVIPGEYCRSAREMLKMWNAIIQSPPGWDRENWNVFMDSLCEIPDWKNATTYLFAVINSEDFLIDELAKLDDFLYALKDFHYYLANPHEFHSGVIPDVANLKLLFQTGFANMQEMQQRLQAIGYDVALWQVTYS